jgi:hypothetical protein
LAGSIADSVTLTSRSSSATPRAARSRSTAPACANCAPVRPSTNSPRRILPASSIARSTGETAAKPPASDSACAASRLTTP